jgi:uncharacterized delta-60 repeat protein
MADGPDAVVAVQADADGNVYVTGSSIGEDAENDYATIKYGPDGDTVWVRRYGGTASGPARATALQLDGTGNVYVTGESYNQSTQQYDYTTVKYNADGDTVWVRRYDGPANQDDTPMALKVDTAGNVYVTGLSSGDGLSTDFATVKRDADGDTAWVRFYDGPDGMHDLATALQVDGAGNVYVTGQSTGAGTGDDYAIVKYNADGDTVWVRRYDGTASGDDQPWDLQVDTAGNVYVTGQSTVAGRGYDYATVKYNADGDTVWVRYYDGPDSGDDVARALQVDTHANVYVTGTSGSDFITVKYSAEGATLWVRRYDGPISGLDDPCALQLDSVGNAYVTGESQGLSGLYDYATLQYSADGAVVSLRRYNGPSGGTDRPRGLHVDASGNVYVTGQSQCAGSGASDYLTIKYLPVPCAQAEPPEAASLSPIDGSSGANDLVFSWDSVEGASKYQAQFDTSVAQDFESAPLFRDTVVTEDAVTVHGIQGLVWWRIRSITACDTSAWTTPIRYTDVQDSDSPSIPHRYQLYQNHPNPFNAATAIKFTLPTPSDWTLRIYNIMGQRIRSFGGSDAPGTIQVEWDGRSEHRETVASGVYFYRLETSEFIETREMVLLK